MRDGACARKTNIFKMNRSDQAKLLSPYNSHPEAKGCLGVKGAPMGATYMF